jgi:hypothetical protein
VVYFSGPCWWLGATRIKLGMKLEEVEIQTRERLPDDLSSYRDVQSPRILQQIPCPFRPDQQLYGSLFAKPVADRKSTVLELSPVIECRNLI